MLTKNFKTNNGEISCVFNKFAKQADGSVLIGFNDTRILVTVCESKRDQENDFFPLTVNYEERLYSAGKIPGNYKRREGQPSEQATLSARMIDRPIRPLFANGYNNEVQIICQVLAKDENFEADTIATTGASLALNLASNIPFMDYVACVHIGYIEGEFVLNPSYEQMNDSLIDLKIAGSYDAINMVEAGAKEVSEELMINALMFGHEEIKKIVLWQKQIVEELGVVKEEYISPVNEDFDNAIKVISEQYSEEIKKALCTVLKQERADKLSQIKKVILEDLDEELVKPYSKAFDEIEKDLFRKLITIDKYRVDGRKTDELRKLTSEIDVLPVVHGSALFTRGETQVLNALTLGVKRDAQTFDGLEFETERRFMLHYNFPPFSVGETGRIGSPGRREIGHGNLAQRALEPVLPSEEEFPYTIRLVGEVLESNGSSSQATICSGSMSLMAGGVPIKKQVAGIAMGLIAEGEDYTILTDIQGLEDHLGDMDFKVAGTKDGITALQMDIKISGVSKEILTESLEQAKTGRAQILENMNEAISSPREEVSSTVEKVVSFKIEESKIKDVIGRGGDMINKIIEQTEVKIDIEEDGQVYVYSKDQDRINEAKEIILKIAKVYKVGEKYDAKVVRIEKYGAFVKFDKNTDGLLHISDLSSKRVEKVEDVVKLEQDIKIEIKEIDNKNRIKVKLISEE